MSFKNGVLEGSRLDFGGPGLDFWDPEARFWRVLERFFRDFPSLLAGNMQELLSNFKLKLRGSSWELQLPVPIHLTPTSNFNHEFPKGRWAAVAPPGGLQLNLFIHFWKTLGLPKSTQNHKNSQKNAKMLMFQKHMLFNTIFSIFHHFGFQKTAPKCSFVSYLFENVEFVKIIIFPYGKLLFFRNRASKNQAKSMPKRIRKKHRTKI